MEELAGKTAVVTGAASGIGRAMAFALAAEGVRVAALDIDLPAVRDVADEIGHRGGEARPYHCDVSVRAEVRATADQVFGDFGAVHILCNNAGVTKIKPVNDLTDDEWDWVIGADLMSVIYGYQAYLPRMLSQGEGGHIVNTSSGVGVVPDIAPFHTAYAAAKAGSVALTSSLRLELEGSGIGVSVICPGMVRTDILRSNRVRPERFGGPDDEVESIPGVEDPLDGALDPAIVGSMVVEAIKANRQFIFPHPAIREAVVAYYEKMLADF